MPFQVRASHINQDFTFDPIPEKTWVQSIEAPHELALFLNRVAIATSQEVAAYPPIMAITYDGRQVTVEAVAGFLYYSDPASTHRRNLKVLAEEVAPLIQGEAPELVFAHRDRMGELPEGGTVRCRAGAGRRLLLRRILRGALFTVIGISGYVIFDAMNDAPMLVRPVAFIPRNMGQDGLLPKLEGVYVSEFRDGGFVCEIKKQGDFVLYEMWPHGTKDGFALVHVETLKLREGLHDGAPVLLAGQFRLIRPLQNGDIAMQGIVMGKQTSGLEGIGEVRAR